MHAVPCWSGRSVGCVQPPQVEQGVGARPKACPHVRVQRPSVGGCVQFESEEEGPWQRPAQVWGARRWGGMAASSAVTSRCLRVWMVSLALVRTGVVGSGCSRMWDDGERGKVTAGVWVGEGVGAEVGSGMSVVVVTILTCLI